MKLTTMKLSVPVLMLMMFQSGYGTSDWFFNALGMASKGQTLEAIDYVREHKPDALKIVDKDVAKNAMVTDVNEKIGDVVPEGLVDKAGFIQLVKNALLNLGENDIDVTHIQDALKNQILSKFYDGNAGWWHMNGDDADNITRWENAVGRVWSTTIVPPKEGEQIDVDLLGVDYENPGDNTIRGFIAGIAGYGDDDGLWMNAWNTLVNTDQRRGLTLVGDENIFINEGDFINNLKAVEGQGGNAAKEEYIFGLLQENSEVMRQGVLQVRIGGVNTGITVSEDDPDEVTGIQTALAEIPVEGGQNAAPYNVRIAGVVDGELDRVMAERVLYSIFNQNRDDGAKTRDINNFFRTYWFRNIEVEATHPEKDILNLFKTYLEAVKEEKGGENYQLVVDDVKYVASLIVGSNIESFLRSVPMTDQAKNDLDAFIEYADAALLNNDDLREMDQLQELGNDQMNENQRGRLAELQFRKTANDSIKGKAQTFANDVAERIVRRLKNIKEIDAN